MGRSRRTVWRWRILAVLALLVLAASAAGWWYALRWAPPRAGYAVQGLVTGEAEGPISLSPLRQARADFVYLEASRGGNGRDASFGRNLAVLAGAGIPHGAVHLYDPCVDAEEQAANFVTIVPRDADLLPPAIALAKLASACGDPIVEAGLESELTTFINQIEGHTGQPVVLKITPEFEKRYAIASRIERNLWLEQDYLEPDYAGRPWTLWTANSHLRNPANGERMRWVVVQP